MITLRKSADRGHFDFGWLDTRHTFSFGEYHAREHMGFSVLRVINEDRVAAGKGFEPHGHRDMEIVSYVIEGALEHRDSMGNRHVMKAGEVQRMSAGKGVQHSEMNHRSDIASHFLQIWILPDRKGHDAGYEQKDFAPALAGGDLVRIVSGKGRDAALSIHQDVEIFAARPSAGRTYEYAAGRKLWVQVIRGSLEINSVRLDAGDGAAIESEPMLKIASSPTPSEFIVFDLPV